MIKRHWLPTLLAVWCVMALCTFAVMLTHQSDQPTILGRYSTLVAGMLVVLAALTLAAGMASVLLARRPALSERVDVWLADARQKRLFTPFVLALAGVILILVWLFFLGNHVATYAMLRAFVVLTIILAVLAALFGGADERSARWKLVAIATLIILITTALITISIYPTLYRTDEAFIFSMGRNFAETGHTGVPIFRFSIPYEDFGIGDLWTRAMGVWLRVVGMGLAQGRLFFLLMGYLSLPFLWFAAKRFYDSLTAWVAVILAAFTYSSLNYVRPDVESALFLSIALFLYSLTLDHEERWWAHLLTGFTVGLCVDGAPIAFVFGLGFALFYFGQYIRQIQTARRWFWPPFWMLAVGGILSLIVILPATNFGTASLGSAAVGTVQTPQVDQPSAGEQISNYILNIATKNILTGGFISVGQMYFNTFLTYAPILFIFVMIGLVTAYRRRLRINILLLVLYFVWTGIVIFTYFYFPGFYLTHGMPILILLAAQAVTYTVPKLIGLTGSMTGQVAKITLAFVSLWLLTALALNLYLSVSSASSLEDVVETGKLIAQIVPKEAVIVAAEPYYFGMLDHRGFVGGASETEMVEWRKMTAEQGWDVIAPDAIVFSANWSTEPGRTPALVSYMNREQITLASCWQTDSFGRIELWMRASIRPLAPVSGNTCVAVCKPHWVCSKAP